MTDTVNVHEAIERLDAVANGASVSDVYGGEWCMNGPASFRADLGAALTAAPKAEPVSDPDKLEPLLWSMHVLGPDDVYPAPDLATAFKWCEYVNSELAPRTPDVLCAAIPALWDGTAEQHAKSLPEAIKGWTVPAQPEAPKVEQEPVAWTETFIAEEEDCPAVGILIDMPDGSQIWTGEVSDALLNASDERPDESGIFLVVARKSEGVRVVASVATPEDGFELARLIAARAPHTHPAPASDELLEGELFQLRVWLSKERDGKTKYDTPQKRVNAFDEARRIVNKLAKHKGPQS